MMDSKEITRIDLFEFIDRGNGDKKTVKISKFREGWQGDPGARPEISFNQLMSLEQMTAWMEEQGWIVRRWPGGARGFKHALHPVHTRYEIKKLREILTRRKASGDPELQAIELHGIDLAYSF